MAKKAETLEDHTGCPECAVQQRRQRKHRHVVVHYGNIEAHVDEGIADVILETWRAGIETVECCQGRYESWARCKRAYFAFRAPEAERWMKILAADAPWMGTVDYSDVPADRSAGKRRDLSRRMKGVASSSTARSARQALEARPLSL